MSEFLRKFVNDKRVRVGAALAGLSLTVAACSSPGVDANKAGLGPCGGDAPFTHKGYDKALDSAGMFKQSVQHDLEVLQKRTLSVGGEIDFIVNGNAPMPNADKLTAGSDTLVIYFPDNVDWGVDRSLTFHFTNGRPNVTIGSIACTSDNGIYPNNAYDNIELLMQKTESLSPNS